MQKMLVGLIVFLVTTSAYATEIGKAPPLPPEYVEIPSGIQPPIKTDAGAWLLPPKTADYIAEKLHYLKERPALCQVALDKQLEVLEMKMKNAIEISEAECLANRVESEAQIEERLKRWQLIVMVTGAAVLGAAGGVFVGLNLSH